MRAARSLYPVAGALALGLAVAWWCQRQTVVKLMQEVTQARELSREAGRLRVANERLIRGQISLAEIEGRRVDRAAMARLREEIERLKNSRRNRSQDAGVAVIVPTGAEETKEKDPVIAATMAENEFSETGWRNRGREAPGAALETLLWAARNGDTDTMAAMIALEGPALEKAEAMLSGLSGPLRAQYDTPERLVALLTARDVPVGIRLMGFNGGATNTRLLVRLQNAGGGIKETEIALRRDPDGWRLVAPLSAVEGYAATTWSLMPLPR